MIAMFIRIVAAFGVAAMAVIVTGAKVPAAKPAVVQASRHCRSAERVVYSCAFGKKIVSVCAGGESLSYRYGSLRKREMEITSDGSDGRLHQGFIVGGGPGGRQSSIRFSNGGYDYIVYSARGGAYTDVAGQSWSGLVVLNGDTLVREASCRFSGPEQKIDLDSLPVGIGSDEDKDLGWW